MLLAPLKVDCARVHVNVCVRLLATQTLRVCCAPYTSPNTHILCVCVCGVFLTFWSLSCKSSDRWNESTVFARTHVSQPSPKERM